jgi:hypothetical protein
MTFSVSQKQYDILLGLRHWMAVKAKMIERYPEEYNRESESIHKTICGLFDEADHEKIPFWVQNIVCGFQDDWRHSINTYLFQDLEKRNVNCDAVSCR